MKLNWGTSIVMTFIVFAVGTFIMVYISMTTNVDLVTDDYYEKELKYQDHIELVKNTNSLDQKIDFELSASSLQIKYPDLGTRDAYSGTINFFRPSDKRGDFTQNVTVDSNYLQTFPIEKFSRGLWRAKISWSVGQKQYYSELPIIIQ